MTAFSVPTRDEVTPENQALFDNLKKGSASYRTSSRPSRILRPRSAPISHCRTPSRHYGRENARSSTSP